MVICNDKIRSISWVKVYPQFKLFSFDVVDSYHGDFCMPALPVCDHVFKYLENYFHFLGGDHIPDCLHCGSCKFVLIWNVQSHADDVVGCNSHFAVTAN